MTIQGIILNMSMRPLHLEPSQSFDQLTLTGSLLIRALKKQNIDFELLVTQNNNDASDEKPWVGFKIKGQTLIYRAGVFCEYDPVNQLRGKNLNHRSELLVSDKHATKEHLNALGISTPKGYFFRRRHLEKILALYPALSLPVCVKPNNARQGQCVTTMIQSYAHYESAVTKTAASFKNIVIEESVSGSHYRFYYVSPKIAGVRLGIPLSVVGDGQHTILTLLELKNRERRNRQSKTHPEITCDIEMEYFLSVQGYTFESVPSEGTRVFLRPSSAIAAGADTVLLSLKSVHPSYLTIVEQACQSVEGFYFGGVDIVIQDISVPAQADNYWILELNAHPSFSPFVEAWEGEDVDVATDMVSLLLREYPFKAIYEQINQNDFEISQKFNTLDLTTQTVANAARARGIPCHVLTPVPRTEGVPEKKPWLTFIINGQRFVYRLGMLREFGIGQHKMGRGLNHRAALLVANKHGTKEHLAKVGVNTPKGYFFRRRHKESVLACYPDLVKPVCVKPNNGLQGIGVTTMIATYEDYEIAVRKVFEELDYKNLVVEESVMGEHFRFFYVQPNVVGVRQGIPFSVVGNGESTILELLELKNRERKERQSLTHPPKELNDEMKRLLAVQGFTQESIPNANQRVFLGVASSYIAGADTILYDLTRIHPSYLEIVERACQSVPGLYFSGVDIVIADIYAAATEDNYWILELNDTPGIAPFYFPWEGDVVDVAGRLVELLQGCYPFTDTGNTLTEQQ